MIRADCACGVFLRWVRYDDREALAALAAGDGHKSRPPDVRSPSADRRQDRPTERPTPMELPPGVRVKDDQGNVQHTERELFWMRDVWAGMKVSKAKQAERRARAENTQGDDDGEL